MSQCFISSNQESLISSKLLTKHQEEKRKDRENVNRDYRYLLILGQKNTSVCVFILFLSKLSTKEVEMYCCWIAWYLYLVFSNKCHYNPFLFRAPIPMNSLLRPLVITLSLSPHQDRCLCANVSMWSNFNLSSGPDYPNHRS